MCCKSPCSCTLPILNVTDARIFIPSPCFRVAIPFQRWRTLFIDFTDVECNAEPNRWSFSVFPWCLYGVQWSWSSTPVLLSYGVLFEYQAIRNSVCSVWVTEYVCICIYIVCIYLFILQMHEMYQVCCLYDVWVCILVCMLYFSLRVHMFTIMTPGANLWNIIKEDAWFDSVEHLYGISWVHVTRKKAPSL